MREGSDSGDDNCQSSFELNVAYNEVGTPFKGLAKAMRFSFGLQYCRIRIKFNVSVHVTICAKNQFSRGYLF